MSRRLPSLNALRAFEAAARQRSFARAAEELHVSPAAISQQIKQLEEYLGMALFRRGKTLALSDSAAAALPLLTEAFDQLQRAVDGLGIHRQDGPLVVSAPPTFAARWLISRLDDFQTRYPQIELRLLATRRLVDFELEDVDVAIRFGSGPFEGLHAERLMEEAIVPVASPELARDIKAVNDMAGFTLLHDDGLEWDPAFPDWETFLASLGVEFQHSLRIRHFGDTNLAIQAAVSGLGIVLAWSSLVADELASGRLVHLFDRTIPTTYGYHFVVPQQHIAAHKVSAFREWLLEQGRVYVS